MKFYKNTALTVPHSCSQSWDEMTPVRGGSFCDHCQKTVVDFTLMSDTAILLHIKQKGFGCGKFREDQLNRVLLEQQIPKRRWWAHFFLSLFGFFISQKEAFSQRNRAQQHVTEVHQTTPNTLRYEPTQHPENLNTTDTIFSISGTVTNHDGNPLINAKVEIRQAGVVREVTVTDYDGNFLIRPLDGLMRGQSMQIRFIWHNSQQTVSDVIIRDKNTVVNVVLDTRRPDGLRPGEVRPIIRKGGYQPLVNPKEPTRQSIPLNNYSR